MIFASRGLSEPVLRFRLSVASLNLEDLLWCRLGLLLRSSMAASVVHRLCLPQSIVARSTRVVMALALLSMVQVGCRSLLRMLSAEAGCHELGSMVDALVLPPKRSLGGSGSLPLTLWLSPSSMCVTRRAGALAAVGAGTPRHGRRAPEAVSVLGIFCSLV